MNILVCFVKKVRDGIHNIVQGRFLVPEAVAAHESPPMKNIILDVVFFGGAIFAPIYYCVLRDIILQIYSCNYKIVKVKK
ncbi:hypothetical protein DOY81_014247 [Sarcophaga bullata]|nr:hypothetical protein DOY81_014247 [Sarcophaga bullata]